MTNELILDAMKFAAVYNIRNTIDWIVDDNNDIILCVVCDDFFEDKTVDRQFITDDNINCWRTSVLDVVDINPQLCMYGPLLYCCRMRSMRPQGTCYRKIPEQLWPLFDECGPKRKIGFGNPKSRLRQHTNGHVEGVEQ